MNFDAEKAARLFSAVDADSSDSIQWTEFVSIQIDDSPRLLHRPEARNLAG